MSNADAISDVGLELEAPRSTRSNLEFAVIAPVESTDMFPDIFDFYGDQESATNLHKGEPKKQGSRLGMLLRSKKRERQAEKRKLRNLLLRTRKSMDFSDLSTYSASAGKSKDLKQVLASLALRN